MKESKGKGISFVNSTTIIVANKLEYPVSNFEEFFKKRILIFPRDFIK